MTDEVQTDRFRNISGHPEDLTGGRVVGAGGFVDLTGDEQNDEFNKAKLAEHFVQDTGPVENPPENDLEESRQELLERAAALEIKGRTSMRNDVLKTAIIEAEANNEKEGDI